MLLKASGKILKTSNGFLSITQDSDIILTFRVRGTCFPAKTTQGRNLDALYRFVSRANIENTVYIDYQDGTGEHAYAFKSSGSTRRIDFRNLANGTTPATIQGSGTFDETIHYYQDLPVEVIGTVQETYPVFRDVTIRFEKPQDIIEATVDRTRVWGVISSSISKMRGLNVVLFREFNFIDAFAQDFYNSSIRNLTLSMIGNIMESGLPLWIVNSNFLTSLNLADSINLSGDPITKRLSQINKLKDTLQSNLNLQGSGINYPLPEEFGELYKLRVLTLTNNTSPALRFPTDLSQLTLRDLYIQNTRMPFSEIERIIQDIPTLELLRMVNCAYNVDYDFSSDNLTLKDIRIGFQQWNSGAVPSFINRLKSLERLYIIGENIATIYANLTSYGDFSACTELNYLNIGRMSHFTTTIPAWFNSLIKLKEFSFQASFQSSNGIDDFVDNFYDFIVANASMSVGDTPFRNMTMNGYGTNASDQNASVRPSGTYQLPSGFVLGSNNGSPASQMEKIWVLVNQYGHSWTVKPA